MGETLMGVILLCRDSERGQIDRARQSCCPKVYRRKVWRESVADRS